jgi:tetratricopeptide (TPR) repeat protein
LLEEAGDHAGLVHVWYAIGDGVENCRGGYETFVHASEEAIRHARLAGQRWAFLFDLVLALISGPCPADEALRRIDDALPEHPHPADLLLRSILVGMLGDLDDARSLAADANERLVEYRGFGGEHWLAEVAILAGDHEAAAAHLANACDLLEARGRRNNLSLYVARLGRELHALGRLEDADELARRGRALAAPQDFSPQIAWREAQALVDSSYGRHASAEALAREAVAVAKTTDALNWQGEAWHDLGRVLAEAGRTSEAAQAFEQALGRFERKKNLAMVAQVRPRLAALV